MMEKENTIGFLLGAALGGVVAYYAFKHQDEILSKIHDLEENLDLENNVLLDQAKEHLEGLANNVKSAVSNFTQTQNISESTQEEVEALREEIKNLKAQLLEVKA